MSASAENVQNLITYLPFGCNSSLSGLLSEVTILSSSLKLSATCAHDWNQQCWTSLQNEETCCIDTVMSLSCECMEYLWGQGSAGAACSQTGKAGCFSLPHSAGSIVQHGAAESSAMLGACGETVQTETASCSPLVVNKASLREHHCQEGFFVIQWWQPLNISFVELHSENSLEKVHIASWFLSSHYF